MELLDAVNQIKQLSPTDDCCALVAKHKLNWGHIPCQLKNNQAIWKSILPTLGLRTLIQNLPRLHRIEILAKDNLWTKQVLQRLMKKEAILKSELHPYSFLLHQRIYSKGEKKDEEKWTPNLLITNALNAAFYTAIENVKATGKRICITIDCSNSMKGHIVNSQSLDCRTVAAAISLVMARVETNVKIQGFSEKFVSIPVAPDDTVETIMEKLAVVPLGGTDCSRPMITAKVEDKKYDAFIIITDKDTYKGKTNPAEALIQYRAKTLIPAKFVLIALGVRRLTKTVAIPSDRGMLAVCGFNESLPTILYNFLCDHF
uniref:TROVE domain-containing protein n=2 Tax=Ciona savignyi TaxID=51511 RepID=H2ZBF9_CIOSA